MGQLTRDAGDTMDQARPATYTSDRGWDYRLLPSTEITDAWNIWVEINDDLHWMISPLHYDTYTAVPMCDPTHGYCHGFEVRRTSRRDPSRVRVIGYAENLSDMTWPVEADVAATMNGRPAAKAA